MKLLKFNQDWADEHNVPALACFTEEEYIAWCNSSMGKPNPNYEQEIKEYNIKKEKYDNYCKGLTERNLWTKYPKDYTPEETNWVEQNQARNPYDVPNKATSYLTAYLGNGGECFEDGYHNYLTGQDFIDANIVKVFDVSEDFYNTFHIAKLDSLSLCNVFTIDDSYRKEYEEDED